MANQHFANLGYVWKHLWLAGAVGRLHPRRYVETHAGSAAYRLTGDVERDLGVGMFQAASQDCDLPRSTPYRTYLADLASGGEPSYPGSPLLAMMMLGSACRYVFCDIDPASVDDLLAARERLGLVDNVRVVHGDGLAETVALLETGEIGQAILVHVDPFDFHARDPGGVSALDLLRRLAVAGVPAVAWYHLATPAASLELFHDVVTAAPDARAWCAELQVGGPRANLAGMGAGCGILLAGAALAPGRSMRRSADAYVAAFNKLSAGTGVGVSVTNRFVTSA